jgi:hypothetical protein
MFGMTDAALAGSITGLIVIFFVLKEVVAYRLPASHVLNQLLNSRTNGGSRGGDASWDVGCDSAD